MYIYMDIRIYIYIYEHTSVRLYLQISNALTAHSVACGPRSGMSSRMAAFGSQYLARAGYFCPLAVPRLSVK